MQLSKQNNNFTLLLATLIGNHQLGRNLEQVARWAGSLDKERVSGMNSKPDL